MTREQWHAWASYRRSARWLARDAALRDIWSHCERCPSTDHLAAHLIDPERLGNEDSGDVAFLCGRHRAIAIAVETFCSVRPFGCADCLTALETLVLTPAWWAMYIGYGPDALVSGLSVETAAMQLPRCPARARFR